jgi:putative folate metabolism gamma-glutamate ligase
MKVTTVKTRIVEVKSCDIQELLSESLSSIPENSVLAVTSKVVALCEGNAVRKTEVEKDDLIEGESEFFLPRNKSKYSVYLTIKNNMLVPSAGIDESNANEYYVKWPEDPQRSAEVIWEYIRNKYGLKNVGVILTDSISSPLRWGVTGKCIAYCGFSGLSSRIGKPDLFGRKLKMTRVNIADAMAASAVLGMGEANEQTPLAIIEEIPFIEFKQEPPTVEEINNIHIDIRDDLYSRLLMSVKWKKGGKAK